MLHMTFVWIKMVSILVFADKSAAAHWRWEGGPALPSPAANVVWVVLVHVIVFVTFI